MNNYQQHQNKLNEIKLHLQKCFPEIRMYDRHVGKFYSSRIFNAMKNINSFSELKSFAFSMQSKYLVSINKKGMSDFYAILPIEINGKKIPIHLEFEVKTGRAKLQPDQIQWRKICEMMSVKFIEARDKEQVEKEINDYISWIKS